MRIVDVEVDKALHEVKLVLDKYRIHYKNLLGYRATYQGQDIPIIMIYGCRKINKGGAAALSRIQHDLQVWVRLCKRKPGGVNLQEHIKEKARQDRLTLKEKKDK